MNVSRLAFVSLWLLVRGTAGGTDSAEKTPEPKRPKFFSLAGETCYHEINAEIERHERQSAEDPENTTSRVELAVRYVALFGFGLTAYRGRPLRELVAEQVEAVFKQENRPDNVRLQRLFGPRTKHEMLPPTILLPNQEARACLERAAKRAEEGQPQAALAEYRLAVRSDPGNGLCWALLGDAVAAQKDRKNAEETLKRALELEPTNYLAHRFLAAVAEGEGDEERARRHLIEALAGEPSEETNWEALAEHLARHGRRLRPFTLTPYVFLRQVKDDQWSLGIVAELKNKPAAAAAWLAYGERKLKWRHEKYREVVGAERPYQPTFAELVDCHTVLLEKWLEMKQKAEEAGIEAPRDFDLDGLTRIAQAGYLRAHLLLAHFSPYLRPDLECFKRLYPQAIRQYIETFLIVPQTG